MPPILSLRHYSHDQIAHSHEHVQLVFGLRGQLDFEIAGRGSRIGQQLLAVVPATTHHACGSPSGSPSGSHCLVVDVPPEAWLRERLGQHAEPSLRLLERPDTLRLSPAQQQLVNWLAASPINDPVIAEQGTTLLLACLSGGCEPAGERSPLPLAAIDAHIARHLGHPLQVGDLARLAGLSVARLHARFVAETGLTPMEYVRQHRLRQGHALLRDSRLPVGEIAARVGYASQSAFTAALGRAFGCTPRELRRELRDKSHH